MADRRTSTGPLLWPDLSAERALAEWPALRRWVEVLEARYPSSVRLPACWWRHNDFVESLSALRDFERAAFAPNAPATSAVDWQRALSEVAGRLEFWTRRLSCAVPGRDHDVIDLTPSDEPDGWREFVASDARRRLNLEAQKSSS